MERLVWTIFSSIIALLFSGLFFVAIRHFIGNLLPAISYSTIKEVFDLLATNELPGGTRFKEIYSDFLFLIFGIYLLSAIIGFLSHKFVIKIGLHSPFSIFKFKNYWYYYFRGRVKNTPKAKGKKYWYTEADILIDQEGKTKMYSGKISDYYVDSAHNQLESIFIEDIRRYKFKESSQDYELVEIPGHVFCVPYTRVLNMNLTYVMQTKGTPTWKKISWGAFRFLYYGSIFILFSLFWIEEVPGLDLPSIWYKAWFTINTWITLSITKLFIRKLLYPEERKQDFPWDHLIGVCFFSVQYLWIIGDRTPASVLIISFVILIAVVALLEEKPKENENHDESGESDTINQK